MLQEQTAVDLPPSLGGIVSHSVCTRSGESPDEASHMHMGTRTPHEPQGMGNGATWLRQSGLIAADTSIVNRVGGKSVEIWQIRKECLDHGMINQCVDVDECPVGRFP